jgi:hypothetical protein
VAPCFRTGCFNLQRGSLVLRRGLRMGSRGGGQGTLAVAVAEPRVRGWFVTRPKKKQSAGDHGAHGTMCPPRGGAALGDPTGAVGAPQTRIRAPKLGTTGAPEHAKGPCPSRTTRPGLGSRVPLNLPTLRASSGWGAPGHNPAQPAAQFAVGQ